MKNGKHELRDFLKYDQNIAEDQDQAVKAHTCVLTDAEISSDDQLNVIVCELLWEGKVSSDEADNLIIPSELFRDPKRHR